MSGAAWNHNMQPGKLPEQTKEAFWPQTMQSKVFMIARTLESGIIKKREWSGRKPAVS